VGGKSRAPPLRRPGASPPPRHTSELIHCVAAKDKVTTATSVRKKTV
jgi:hypothetical protein